MLAPHRPQKPSVVILDDANFNVTALVDTTGAAVERYVYDPYGAVAVCDGSWNALTSAPSTTVLYTGRDLDTETGLYFYRARYYAANLGRFATRDPFAISANEMALPGLPEQINLYAYVGDRPVTFIDPSGGCGGCSKQPMPPTGTDRITKCCCTDKNKKPGKMSCKVKSGPSYDPKGPLTATTLPNRMKQSPEFKRSAEFEQDPDNGTCATCCEVHQNIMWNTEAPHHPGFQPAANYKPNTWYRDRNGSGWMCGSRTQAAQNNCKYEDNMLCGTKFSGSDHPVGLGSRTGWWKFQLVVVDVCNGDKEVTKSEVLTLNW